jgi:hypothetical protein
MAVCSSFARNVVSTRSEPNLMTGRGDVKKSHSINGLSLFFTPGFLYNYCKEGLDKMLPISIFSYD